MPITTAAAKINQSNFKVVREITIGYTGQVTGQNSSNCGILKGKFPICLFKKKQKKKKNFFHYLNKNETD